MSEAKKAGRWVFIWSGQPTKEYLKWVPMAREIRKNLTVCERCGKTIDCALVDAVDEETFEEELADLRERITRQECGKHHLPPMRQRRRWTKPLP